MEEQRDRAEPAMDEQDDARWHEVAREYLDAELGSRAPTGLTLVETLKERPLEGEGPVVLFSFKLSVLERGGHRGNPRCPRATTSSSPSRRQPTFRPTHLAPTTPTACTSARASRSKWV